MTTYDVLLSGVMVGYLTATSDGRIAFRFTDDYKKMLPRPVLSQFFEDDLNRTYRSKGSALPAFFENLIAEGQLLEIIEASLGLPRGDSLSLLAAVSDDLPGAVQIVASEDSVEMLSNGTAENGSFEATHSGEVAVTPDLPEVELRFSLAGVQMKFSLLTEHEKLTLPARGGRGEWIVKLDSARFPRVVENEFATMEWARASGFVVPVCHVLPVSALPDALRKYAGDDTHVLAVERYDRLGQKRIHQEDFAQVTGLPPSLKYDHISYAQCAGLIRNIVGHEGYLDFVARLTFMIASGNADAHLKNWSLLYADGVTPTLAPLYDQVATIAWPDVTFRLALKFSGTKEFLRIDEDAYARLALRVGADQRSTIAAMQAAVERVVAGWREAHIADMLPPGHAAALRAYWLRAPLFRRYVATLF